MMELRCCNQNPLKIPLHISLKYSFGGNSVKCYVPCDIITSSISFPNLAVFCSPHNNTHTHTHTYNEFSEFELILSSFNGPGYIVQQEVYRMQCSCAMRCDTMWWWSNKYKLTKRLQNGRTNEYKKIKYWIMKSQTWKPENFCAGINNERNACLHGFIHFEIRIKWNDLFIQIALHDADFGWVYHLRLLRIEFNNNNLAATRGGGTWTLRFVHTTHSHNSVLIEFNIQY